MMGGLFTFFDSYRYIFMGAALVLVIVAQVGLRKAHQFKPTKFVWIITVLVVTLIVGELYLDPPWARHVNVPM